LRADGGHHPTVNRTVSKEEDVPSGRPSAESGGLGSPPGSPRDHGILCAGETDSRAMARPEGGQQTRIGVNAATSLSLKRSLTTFLWGIATHR
jgi:hypothetical protein